MKRLQRIIWLSTPVTSNTGWGWFGRPPLVGRSWCPRDSERVRHQRQAEAVRRQSRAAHILRGHSARAPRWFCMTINILGDLHDTLAVAAEDEGEALARARAHGYRPSPGASVVRVEEYGLRFVNIILRAEET